MTAQRRRGVNDAGRTPPGSALISHRQLLVHEALEDVPVTRLMQTRLTPDITVETLVYDHLPGGEPRTFPVFDGNRFLGVIRMQDIREVARKEWPRMRAEGGNIKSGCWPNLIPSPRPSRQLLPALLYRRHPCRLPGGEESLHRAITPATPGGGMSYETARCASFVCAPGADRLLD
jgi:hypothetical protein